MKIIHLTLFFCCYFPLQLIAQTIPKEELVFLTSEWKGERFTDGRPRIPDDLLLRAEAIGIEEAWQILNNEGYLYQYERNWEKVHDDVKVIGRALTARYMPVRPDVERNILERGEKEGREGRHLHWPINMLSRGDVYVADNQGREGSIIGDNLANAIFKKSGTGVVFNGFARDIDGLAEIEGFNAFVRGFAPQFLYGVILMGLNTPVSIGKAVVLPGDLVIAGRAGVVFIPAHMAELVIATAEFIASRDRFGHAMIAKGRFNAGQLDAQWEGDVREAYLEWLETQPAERKISRAELDQFLMKRTW